MLALSPTRYSIIAGIVLLMATWLLFRDLQRPDYWSDEAYTLLHIRAESVTEMVRSIERNETMPPLYFAVVRAWSRMQSAPTYNDEFYMRALGGLCGVATTAVMVQFGRRVAGETTGLLAGALFVTAYQTQFVVRQIRPYGLGLLCVAVLMSLTLALLQSPSRLRWLLWAMVGAAGIATNYLVALVVAISGVGLWLREWRSAAFPFVPTLAVCSIALCAAGLAPLLLAQLQWSPNTYAFIPPLSVRAVVEMLDTFTLGAELRGWPKEAVLVALPAVVLLTCVGLYLLAKRDAQARFVLVFTLAPTFLVVAVSFWENVFYARYLFIVAPALYVLLAVTLSEVLHRIRWPTVGVSVVLVGLLALNQPNVFVSGLTWSAVAERVAQVVQPGDTVAFTPLYNRLPFELKYAGPDVRFVGLRDYADYVAPPGGYWYALTASELAATASDTREVWVVQALNWPFAGLDGWREMTHYELPNVVLARYVRE
ncbi:MAG: glycosyltransferase family 39 protein [Anaerolineales bacterium]